MTSARLRIRGEEGVRASDLGPSENQASFEDGTRKFASDDLNFICVLFGS